MDGELLAVASTGASTLITLMVTDAWGQAKQAVTALFNRSQPEAGVTIDRDLETSRRQLIAARDRGDDQAETQLIAQWNGRLLELLQTSPDAAKEVQAVVDQLEAAASRMQASNIKLNAKATGHGRVYQQGQGIQHNR